jgi:hypothetical protein
MHPCLVLVVKLFLDTLPGMTQQFSWTFVNLGYLIVSPARPAAASFKLILDNRPFRRRRYLTSCSTGQQASHSRRACTAARMTTSRFGNKSTRASSLPPPRNGSFASPSYCTYSMTLFPSPARARRTHFSGRSLTNRSAQVLAVHPLYTL